MSADSTAPSSVSTASATARPGVQGLLAKRTPKSWALLALGIVVILALPHLGVTKDSAGVLPIFTVVLCAVYALFSLGLNIVVGFAGLLDLGYVAFFLFGAYVAAWFMSDFFFTKNLHILDTSRKVIPGIHLTFWFVVLLAGVIAAITGVIIGAPTLRLKSDYLALVTLGFGEILPEVFRNGDDIAGANITNGTKGIGPVDRIGTGFLHAIPGVPKAIGPSDYIAKYYVIVVFCALFIWISVKLRDGRLGRAWMAIREDELAASLMGVPLMRTKLWSYAVGAFAGGIGGAFYATIVGTVNVDNFTFAFSIIILCAVILGGMGNVWGAILGGFAITWFNYTGLQWSGTKYNEASRGRLVTYAILILAVGAVAFFVKSITSKTRPSKGTLIGFGIFAGSMIALFAVRLIKPDFVVDLVKYNFGFFGLALVLMMLFRPEGFIPAARSKQVKQSEQLAAAQGADA